MTFTKNHFESGVKFRIRAYQSLVPRRGIVHSAELYHPLCEGLHGIVYYDERTERYEVIRGVN